MSEGKVRRALLYTCKVYGVASRNNNVEDRPCEVFEAQNHKSIMEALVAFATCGERSRLVLELDDGREISIMPVLQEDCLAYGETGYIPSSPVSWDISLDIWPD